MRQTCQILQGGTENGAETVQLIVLVRLTVGTVCLKWGNGFALQKALSLYFI